MVKEIDDYLDKLESKYPKVSREDLKRVLEYGFETFCNLTRRGGDIEVHNGRYIAYCGRLFINSRLNVLYRHSKEMAKLRLKYRYAQEDYNGEYYFGLTDEQWESYQKQISSKKLRKITFENIKLFKIKEESFIDKHKTHFFSLNYPVDVGWSFTKDKITTRNFKHFADRDAKGKIVIL